MKILVIAETDGARVREASYELVALSRELASAPSGNGPGAVVGAVLGAEPREAAAAFAARSGVRTLAIADPLLADYTADGWIAALARTIETEQPDLVLVSHGPQGWDFAPRLAGRCGGSAASECTSIQLADGALVFTRKTYNGRLDLRFTLESGPRVATVQRGARTAAAPAAAPGEVVDRAAGLSDGDVRGRFAGRTASPAGKLDLSQADVIVSGGRALGGPEKFAIIRELAEALGGQVGASRPVTDSGWLPPEHQVGSSGVTVKPKLYVAAGISGAIQHLVGMKGSDFIVAINKDARAPIFEVAHVGVVGDLFEIVPALTAAVREAKDR